MNDDLTKIRKQIEEIKQELYTLSSLRPGSINRQYRKPREGQGVYYQLNYSRKGTSHTEHVRKDELAITQEQTAAYRRLRELVDRWIDLGIEECRLLRAQSRQAKKGKK